jgi:uncharacterized membrane protein YdbT with pleckstrin-like domain
VPYPTKLLNAGEELVLDLRPHWIALLKPGLAVAASIIFGLVVTLWLEVDGGAGDALAGLALLLIVIALLWGAKQLADWSTTNFVLTTDRLISREGLVAKSGTEIPLERINTVFFSQSVFERMIGAGDLSIESAGERGTQHFSNIRRPNVVQREIYVQMEANENRKFDRISGGQAAAPTAADEVAKLHDLLTRGAISQAEYDAQKARLLG